MNNHSFIMRFVSIKDFMKNRVFHRVSVEVEPERKKLLQNNQTEKSSRRKCRSRIQKFTAEDSFVRLEIPPLLHLNVPGYKYY